MFKAYVITLVASLTAVAAVLALWVVRIWTSDALLNERLWHTQVVLVILASVLGIVSASFHSRWFSSKTAYIRDELGL